MPHKGASTQRHSQQVLAKSCHNPSDRDQQVREKLQQKVKIRSQVYIQLGEETLQTIHRTFQPDVPVILHLPALTDGSLNSKSTSTPTLYVIQEGLNCLETTDYFFANIVPAPIIVKHPAVHQNKSLPQQFHNKHTPNSQTKLGSTRLCSPIGKYQNQILQKPTLPHMLISRTHSILLVFVPMVEEKIPRTKAQSEQLSDSDTPDEEADPRFRTSEEERIYRTIRGSTQAMQVALSHSRAQINPTVKRGSPRRPKIKKLSKDKAAEKGTQTKDKEKQT